MFTKIKALILHVLENNGEKEDVMKVKEWLNFK